MFSKDTRERERVTPTQLDRRPESVKNNLNNDQYKLYELIWKRTIASQMAQSKSLETIYSIEGGNFVIRSSGSIQVFDGFKKIYNYSEKNEEQQSLQI